jgi:excisionase family DNA binding protein
MVQEIDGERYFTIREAAGMLQRHPLTVWRWTAEGKIQFHQPYPGSKILIPQHVITLLKKNF